MYLQSTNDGTSTMRFEVDGETYALDFEENDEERVPAEVGEEILERTRDDALEARDERSGGDAGSADDEETDELDELLEGTVDEVTADLESGEYDDRLDELEERAERVTVEDAVDRRRRAGESAGDEEGE